MPIRLLMTKAAQTRSRGLLALDAPIVYRSPVCKARATSASLASVSDDAFARPPVQPALEGRRVATLPNVHLPNSYLPTSNDDSGQLLR
jgi:hypothetical protein